MEQNFCHKVDQKTIPVCPILGVDIAAIDMDWLLAFTKAHVKELSGDYICVSNVHTTVTAWKDEAYRAVPERRHPGHSGWRPSVQHRKKAGLCKDAAGDGAGTIC